MSIKVIQSHPSSVEARELIEELSNVLLRVTGDNGKSSFSNQDYDLPRSSFIIIQENGESIACGSIRPISDDVCEIKRMYYRKYRRGFGKKVLNELEKQAREFGYKEIWLSTRIINEEAILFYTANDYAVCDSYGKYKNQTESICLSKRLK
jgi:N-acetylglutamate synthase-like GNAT family acetyltransferase